MRNSKAYYTEFVNPNSQNTTMSVPNELHQSIKIFAKNRHITLTSALYYLVTLGLEQELKK